MSFLSENVIPGNHGKVFGTNVTTNFDLKRIKTEVLCLDGITDVQINTDVFPKEFTVQTSKLISIKDIEDIVISLGFHAVPKDVFPI